MQFFIFDTLENKKVEFHPRSSDLVKLYICGPTVYNRPHIGNARSVVIYDILYRILMHLFGKDHVIYTRNITDIDDKIIAEANNQGIEIKTLTQRITKQFHEDISYLGCIPPTVEPKATEHIDEMIKIIQILIEKQHAYIIDKCVYFDVSTVKDYTKLSNHNFLHLLDGVRIENNSIKKKHNDFILWKSASDNESNSINFQSPWGKGRPGWHIECSAMSYKYLGGDFDIHGGGIDLIFPHHTNEIAQNISAFPKSKFAKYWIHNGFLTINGTKMSKTLQNIITVEHFIVHNIPGEILRLFFISSQYRKPIDYNEHALENITKILNYWYRAIESLGLEYLDNNLIPKDFRSALLDDMNFPLAIQLINSYAKNVFLSKSVNDKKKYASYLLSCGNFIGVLTKNPNEWFHNIKNKKEIEDLIQKRYLARSNKDWVLSDKIRADLLEDGIFLEDLPNGKTIWKKEKYFVKK